MPAKQKIDYRNLGYLEITIDPDEEPENVYFTCDEPKFDLVFRNKTDKEIRTREDESWTGVQWVLELEPGADTKLAIGDVRLSIEPGREHRERIKPGLLAYESNAVLGLTGGGVELKDEDEDEFIELSSNISQKYIDHILYTFTIWDKSHYEAVHEQPKRLMKYIIGFGFLTVILAAMQLYVVAAG